MSIIRSRHEKGFLMLDAEVLRKHMLSPEALGLFVAMLDRADDWDFYARELSATFRLTRERTEALLGELERKGFIRSKPGRYGPAYDLFERPEPKPAPPPDPEADDDPRAEKLFAFAAKLAKERGSGCASTPEQGR